MLQKFFPGDKNYVLERVQRSLQPALLQYLVDQVKITYLNQHNPLGIEDRTIKLIRDHQANDFRHLSEFYIALMGVYRFKYYSDNQLAFDFSGRDPADLYRDEWTEQFHRWVKSFCQHRNFLRAVLDLTVFYPADCAALRMDARMQTFVTRFFGVVLHPQKGIIRKKAA
ncbi:MAG TPA: hypothetical protein VKZ75_05275 [Cyclobacteriaceae bacterium]|nr:hypothetical protein [Cyclobacteriaceae bacterium]